MYRKENVLLIGYLSDKKRGLLNEPMVAIPFHADLLRYEREVDEYREISKRLGLKNVTPPYPVVPTEPYLPGIMPPGYAQKQKTIRHRKKTHFLVNSKEHDDSNYYLVIVSPKMRSKIRKALKNKIHWADRFDLKTDFQELRQARRRQMMWLLKLFANQHESVRVLHEAANT